MANAKNSKLKSIFCGIAVALAAVLCLSVPFLLKKGNDNSSGKANVDVIEPNVTYYKHNVVLTIDTSQAVANTTAKTAFTVYDQKVSETLTKDSILEYLNADPDLIKGIYFVTTDVSGGYQGYFTAYDKETSVASFTTKSGDTGICPFSNVLSVEDNVTKVKGIPEQDNYYIDRLWTSNGSNFTYKNVNSTSVFLGEDKNGSLFFLANSAFVSDIQADITFTLDENIDYSKYDFVRVLFYCGQGDPVGGLSFYVGKTKLNVFSRSFVDLTSNFTGDFSGKESYYLQIPATLFNGTITIKASNSKSVWFTPIMADGIKN